MTGDGDAARDFWRRSGFHLLKRDGRGHLVPTDDFLRAYLSRPELAPVDASCAQERALHADLLAEPRQHVPPSRLEALADADAAENYRVYQGFRDLLGREKTIEAAYLSVIQGRGPALPALFLDHMVQVMLRGLLAQCEDPIRLRAAELLFRTQMATATEGGVVMADEETVAMRMAAGAVPADALLGGRAHVAREVELDVLGPDNAGTYWDRSDRYDTALDATFERFGLDALARVLETWCLYLIGHTVTIQPVTSIRDKRWRWHIGLDVEATAILNDLYEGQVVDSDRLHRLLALFRLELRDEGAVLPEMRGRPVYLAMAMSERGRVRLKPQNLLVNLPLAAAG